MKIAIVEDEEFFLDKIAGIINDYFNDKSIDISLCKFYSAEELLPTKLDYHIILLDIQLPQMDGMSCAKKLRSKGWNGYLIFVSAYQQYALYGYEYNAFRYLLKDHLDISLVDAFDKVCHEVQKSSSTLSLRLINEEQKASGVKSHLSSIRLENIIYIESKNHKAIIHCSNEKTKYQYLKLDDLEESIHSNDFFRIHKSYLVNLSYLKTIQNYEAYLINGIVLPIARSKYADAKKAFITYRGRV